MNVSDLRLDYYWLWNNLCKNSFENFLNDVRIIWVYIYTI